MDENTSRTRSVHRAHEGNDHNLLMTTFTLCLKISKALKKTFYNNDMKNPVIFQANIGRRFPPFATLRGWKTVNFAFRNGIKATSCKILGKSRRSKKFKQNVAEGFTDNMSMKDAKEIRSVTFAVALTITYKILQVGKGPHHRKAGHS